MDQQWKLSLAPCVASYSKTFSYLSAIPIVSEDRVHAKNTG